MPTVSHEVHGDITIPRWVVDVASFWRWRDAAELPEKLKVHFLRGDVWVDMNMEELFSHNRVKTALGLALATLIEEGELGLYVGDGMSLSCPDAGFVTEPDAMFLSNEAIEAGRVRFEAGKRRKAKTTRVVGTPDLVVEIVSPNTADKDTEWLMSAYHDAGIPEYWLIDARKDESIRFDVFQRKPREFVAARKSAGWVKSAALSKEFRLTRSVTAQGYPRYTLEAR
jgi:Uma2 family endonuclease